MMTLTLSSRLHGSTQTDGRHAREGNATRRSSPCMCMWPPGSHTTAAACLPEQKKKHGRLRPCLVRKIFCFCLL
ncbi:hypothetical protein BDA96_03G286800 [Sorghum bicolor]|uniref:Uncharacterized protein n=1 Tax=Sorghum bicolor TaxID=4558 RepID=A0A921UPZ4_SORBI|nr:hypothetical protein BDA96_03G286800 [Sorghum bicolor]